MKLVDQVIFLLESEPQEWIQGDYTLKNSKREIEIWTSNVPFFNTEIYRPIRKISLINKIKLQLAVYRWHKRPLILD